MAALSFSAPGGQQLTFSVGRTYPLRQPRERLQVLSRSAAGTLRVADKGLSSVRRLRLAFRGLPAADHAALLTWYEEVACGSLNPFTFTDEAGAAHTVRWSGPFDLEQAATGRYSGEVVLEEVA